MSIEKTRAIDTPQKSYEWEIEIVGPSIGGLEGLSAYAQTASIPEESIEEIVINHKSERTVHAGRVASARTTTINFMDDESLTVFRYIRQWQEIIKNSVSGGGVPRSLYVADIIVRQFNTDSQTVTAEHRLRGAFPTSRGEISLSYDASEVMNFDVTFSYERLDLE